MKTRLNKLWLAVLATCVAATVDAGDRPLSTAPIKWVDPDNRSIPKPKEIEENLIWDIVDHTFFYEVGKVLDLGWSARRVGNLLHVAPRHQADNVNVLDEVPNSSWYTNRHFLRRMDAAALARGPGHAQPDTSGAWEVISGKFEGLAPGFTVRDAKGAIYFFKFDPKEYDGLATTAEVVSTKILYAAGYHVPRNSVVFFSPDWLTVGAEAEVVDGKGGRRAMTAADLQAVLDGIQKQADGRIRCLASASLPGVPIGVFDFHGRRKDDPNDRISHEHRRELRGLRVISSWLNDTDRRAANTLNMFVTDGRGRQYIEHYLIDMGATLGSSTLRPRSPKTGNEYFVDVRHMTRSILSLGLYRKAWEEAGPMPFPSVGYLESEVFSPGNWVTNYPNPAFQNCTNRDGYWGAKIAMAFGDSDLQAIVKTARLPDKKAEAHLVQLLKERRDKVGDYWFRRANPLDRFWVNSRGLHFEDLAITGRLATAKETRYVYRIVNPDGKARSPNRHLDTPGTIPIPRDLPEGQYCGIELRTLRPGWEDKYIRVYFYVWKTGRYQIVRVDREE